MEAWHLARLAATQAEDCGTCVQIVVTLAKADGVAPGLIQTALAGALAFFFTLMGGGGGRRYGGCPGMYGGGLGRGGGWGGGGGLGGGGFRGGGGTFGGGGASGRW